MSCEDDDGDSDLKQGQKMCYSNIESKQSLKKKQCDDLTGRSSESMELVSVHSGESLFKTFTFDIRQDHDPNMKKCLAFWKSILEKNVRPVKCSLLKVKSNSKVVKAKENDPCDEQSPEMWMDIYKELQRRKLDKIRMGKTPKYNTCDDYIDEEDDKEKEKEEIKKLNSWTAPKERPGAKKFDANAYIKHTINTLLDQEPEEGLETMRERSRSKDLSQKQREMHISISSMKKSSVWNASALSQREKSTSNIDVNKSGQSVNKSAVSIEKSTLSIQSINQSSQSIIKSRESIHKSKQSINKSGQLKSASNIKQYDEDSEICEFCQRRVDECDDDSHHEKDVDDIIEEASLLSVNCGVPCDCGDVCKCQPRHSVDACKCACSITNCICNQIQTMCTCGCIEEECVCEKILEDPECTCGCGLEECICKLLSKKSCKCGHADCECDLLDIWSTYLDTVDTIQESRVQSKDTQTPEEATLLSKREMPQVQGSYCVICGHYGCFCNVKTGEDI